MNYRKSQYFALAIFLLIAINFGIAQNVFGAFHDSIEKHHKNAIAKLKKIGFKKMPDEGLARAVTYELPGDKVYYAFFESSVGYSDLRGAPPIHLSIHLSSFNSKDSANLTDAIRASIKKQAPIFGVEVGELEPLYVTLKEGRGRAAYRVGFGLIELYTNDLTSATVGEEVCHYVAGHKISPGILPYLAETAPPIVCGPARSLASDVIGLKSKIASEFVKNPQDLRYYFSVLLDSKKIPEMERTGYVMADFFSEYFTAKRAPKELLEFLNTIPEVGPGQISLPVEDFVKLFNQFTKQNLTVEQFFQDFSNFFRSQIMAGTFLKPPKVSLKNMSLPPELLAEEKLLAEIMDKAAKEPKFLRTIKGGGSFTLRWCGRIIVFLPVVVSGGEAYYEVRSLRQDGVIKKIATFPQYWLVNFFELQDIGQPVRDLQQMAEETYRLERRQSSEIEKDRESYLKGVLNDRLQKECGGPASLNQPYSACESKIRKEIKDLELKMRHETQLKKLASGDFLSDEEAIIEFYKLYPGGFVEYYKNPIRWFLNSAKDKVEKINLLIFKKTGAL